MINGDGSISGITGPAGRIPALVINTAVIICIGPFLAIPRTAATTYEMSILPVNGRNKPYAVFHSVFCCCVGPHHTTFQGSRYTWQVPDAALVICLAVLIIAGIIWPLGEITEPVCDNIVREGVLNGYQAMDVLGALGFAIIIIGVTREKGIPSLLRQEKQP